MKRDELPVQRHWLYYVILKYAASWSRPWSPFVRFID